MKWLVIDQKSRFKTTLMKNLTEEKRIRHHFTTVYCPWSNGTVERLCKEILRITSALMSERKLSVGEWSAKIAAIQKVVNQSPVERLVRNNNEKLKCPMEVFSRLKPSSLIIRSLPTRTYRDLKAIAEERFRSIVNIEKVHRALERMHKDVAERNCTRSPRPQIIHDEKINVFSLNIGVGDYVMVRTSSKRNQKLQEKWKGPMRVVEAKNDLLFVLENLNDACLLIACAQRISHIPYPILHRTPR